MIAAVTALLLSYSGVWGARLITNSASGTPQQTPAPGQGENVTRPTGAYPSAQEMPASRSNPVRMNMRKAPEPQTMPEPMPSQADRPEKQVSKDGKQYVTMDFDGVDIKVFVKFIADITGKNFILDDKVNGKVTVISPRKMTLDEAYQVFLSVLDVNGFGTVNMGSVIKVVLAADAVSRSIGTSMNVPKRREDVLITQIIPLKHADANDMKTLFQPLLTKGSSQLMAYPQSNMLIITDTKSNIKKMIEILKFIDAPGFSEDFRIFPLTHASAADLSLKLQEILSDDRTNRGAQGVRTFGQRAGVLSERGKAKIIPYERTNSLIVLASAIDMKGVESLVQRLDIPTPSGKEDIHVYYLQYARAEDIVKVLTDMPSPTKTDTSSVTTAPGMPPDAAARGVRSSAGSDRVKISADKETNSLIIFADPDAYQSILETVKYLDIPRKQVYVKAVFMEVSKNKDLDFGVQWSFFEDFAYDNGDRVGGVFGRSGSKFVSGLNDLPSTAVLGVVGEAITITKGSTSISFPNMTAFIAAMQADTDVNILATPQIITMDNKEAEIKVGANVPYLTREQTDTTNISNTVRTFDYRDVGVTLRLTPQINQQGNIRLELFQENSTLVEGTGDQQYAPTTLKRSAKTTVTVKDGNNIVIGGLIGDTISGGNSGIPILKDIPLLGHLFKTSSRKTEKTNLYIFLTPRIIDTDIKATDLYLEKYGEIDTMMNPDRKKGSRQGKANENPKP
ncbi:MAG TPA: type II secretion system secretin GspD [Deltaproteobacteria bacterium]|nr:type II secretion system secretin GspD [Deltaproteobacteria bacterium]